MSAEKELLIKIKTLLDRSGMDSATQAETQLTQANTTLEKSTAKVAQEQRKAIEVSQQLSAASRGSREGIFGLAKEMTGLGAIMGKATLITSVWIAGWEIGTKIYANVIKPLIDSIGKLNHAADKNQMVEKMTALNKVKLTDFTDQLTRIRDLSSSIAEDLDMVVSAQSDLANAEAELQIAQLRNTEPEGPDRDRKEAIIKSKAQMTTQWGQERSSKAKIEGMEKQDAQYSQEIEKRSQEIAKAKTDWETAKREKPGSFAAQALQATYESARDTYSPQIQKYGQEQERLRTRLEAERIRLQAIQKRRQATSESHPFEEVEITKDPVAFAKDRVAKEQSEAQSAGAAYRNAVGQGAPQAKLNELAARARKEQDEFAAAAAALQQLLSGNAAKLQQIVQWMKTQESKVKNLPTS